MEKDELLGSFKFVFSRIEKSFLTISTQEALLDSNNTRLAPLNKSVKKDKESLYFEVIHSGSLYKATYTVDRLKETKSNLGFEGSLSSFLSLIQQASKSKDCLKLAQASRTSVILTVNLNINEIIRMKFEVQLTKEEHNTVESYAVQIERTIGRIFNHMEEIESASTVQPQPSKQLSLNEDSNSKSMEIKKTQKRRFNSNLINPNIKKRNLLGAKFVVEENSADSN